MTVKAAHANSACLGDKVLTRWASHHKHPVLSLTGCRSRGIEDRDSTSVLAKSYNPRLVSSSPFPLFAILSFIYLSLIRFPVFPTTYSCLYQHVRPYRVNSPVLVPVQENLAQSPSSQTFPVAFPEPVSSIRLPLIIPW